jgi:MFS transporter, PPP family, 3-phenylpropionic acid transporter
LNARKNEKIEIWLTASGGFSGFLRYVVLYAALYAGFGAASPFLPAFFQSRGLAADQIGFVLAVGTATRLLAGPAAGQAADHSHALRTIFAISTTCAALFALTNLTVETFWPLLLVSVLWSAALAPAAPLADALALAAAKPVLGNKGFEYGWVRGAGSAAFILGTIGSGQAVHAFGLGATLVLQATLLVLAAIWIGGVPNYVRAPQTPALSIDRSGPDSIWELLRIPVFLRIIIIAALVLGSHALHDSFAVIRWNAAGISGTVASMLWSEQVVAEVAVFLIIGPVLLNRIGPAWALTVSASAAAVRWAATALTTDPYLLALIEPLHGLTFALLHLASMRVLSVAVPLRLAATAQTIYGTVGVGAAVALLTLASGLLYQHLGGIAFWIMAALCVVAIPVAMTVRMPESLHP